MRGRTEQGYPELHGFTERLLAGLTRVLEDERRVPRAATGAPDRLARRPRPPWRRWAGLALAVVASSLIVAMVVGVLPRRAGGPEAAKAAAFDQAASVRPNGPYRPLRPGEYWYTRTWTVTLTQPASKRYAVVLPIVREVWIGTDGTAHIRVRSGPMSFPDRTASQAWTADGKPALDLAFETFDLTFRGVGFYHGGIGFDQDGPMEPRITHLPFTQPMDMASIGEGRTRTYYQAVLSLPTDPVVLERELRAMSRRHLVVLRRGLPAAVQVESGMFHTVVQLLGDESPAPPVLRRALLEVLRRLPSLQIHEQARDGAGRKGVAVGLRKPIAGPTLIIDPGTGLLLAKREPTFTGAHPKPVFAEEGQTRYLQYGVVPSIGATPS
jgi:hypothetical protein